MYYPLHPTFLDRLVERMSLDTKNPTNRDIRPTQDFQDEIAALNLQMNMAEQKAAKLERENRELVDRWMARMGQEADAMNDASKFS